MISSVEERSSGSGTIVFAGDVTQMWLDKRPKHVRVIRLRKKYKAKECTTNVATNVQWGVGMQPKTAGSKQTSVEEGTGQKVFAAVLYCVEPVDSALTFPPRSLLGHYWMLQNFFPLGSRPGMADQRAAFSSGGRSRGQGGLILEHPYIIAFHALGSSSIGWWKDVRSRPWQQYRPSFCTRPLFECMTCRWLGVFSERLGVAAAIFPEPIVFTRLSCRGCCFCEKEQKAAVCWCDNVLAAAHIQHQLLRHACRVYGTTTWPFNIQCLKSQDKLRRLPCSFKLVSHGMSGSEQRQPDCLTRLWPARNFFYFFFFFFFFFSIFCFEHCSKKRKILLKILPLVVDRKALPKFCLSKNSEVSAHTVTFWTTSWIHVHHTQWSS